MEEGAGWASRPCYEMVNGGSHIQYMRPDFLTYSIKSAALLQSHIGAFLADTYYLR
jgi:hypothetical protein